MPRKRVQYLYEVPSAWGGWHITATYADHRDLDQLVDDAKRRGLQEGRDFRTRTERRF